MPTMWGTVKEILRTEGTGYTVAVISVKGLEEPITYSGVCRGLKTGDYIELDAGWYEHPGGWNEFRIANLKKIPDEIAKKIIQKEKNNFKIQIIRKRIWDKNFGRCELCGQKTNSINDAHFEAITEEGRIFSGDRFYEDEILLCRNCYVECKNRGIVSEASNLYKRYDVDFRDISHPRHITVETRQKVWYRDGGRCQMCGSNENLQYDHIIPFSKGGSNTEENIQLLCAGCNKLKLDNI